MIELLKSASLLLALLNPFLVIVYLLDVVAKHDLANFSRVLTRAGLIAAVVFCCFALLGDAIFSNVVQAEFASFQIFGGVVFLLIGLQFVFRGPTAIEMLRGDAKHLASAIAMPVLVGPGTISASVVIGQRQSPVFACLAIFFAVAVATVSILLLKWLHDYVRPNREALVEHYIDVSGRITSLYVGTIAVEMIMRGLAVWIQKF